MFFFHIFDKHYHALKRSHQGEMSANAFEDMFLCDIGVGELLPFLTILSIIFLTF